MFDGARYAGYGFDLEVDVIEEGGETRRRVQSWSMNHILK